MESGAAMNNGQPLRTVVIGSGNVASAIAPALEEAGAIAVCQVYSPTAPHGRLLAERLGQAMAVSRPDEVAADAELYLVAIKDDAIARVAAELKPVPDAVWLHTSGGVEASEMKALSPNYGVFYPLQTFSKGRCVDLREVPVFIEGATERALLTARHLGEAISTNVLEADGEQRARLHAAAVFACNFTNHLWAIADGILRRETGTNLSVLYPLLRETLRKATLMPPAEAQTGPARRGDTGVMAKHESLLNADEARLYDILSRHIIDYHSHNPKSE